MPVPRSKQKTVISASRRTDIPAFYMDWFMDGLFRGFFDVENPYSRKNHRVAVTPENTSIQRAPNSLKIVALSVKK